MSCIYGICCNFLRLLNLIRNTDWCLFFHRLKINHDSHECILESGTAVNSYRSINKRHLTLLISVKHLRSTVGKNRKRENRESLKIYIGIKIKEENCFSQPISKTLYEGKIFKS
jgi:hypothetical protein